MRGQYEQSKTCFSEISVPVIGKHCPLRDHRLLPGMAYDTFKLSAFGNSLKKPRAKAATIFSDM